jgi:hypothetical protein
VNTLHIDSTLIGELHHVGPRHYVRLLTFILLYGAAGYGEFWLANRYPADGLAFAARLPLYLLAAASLHGISLFTHEGVHGLLSHNRAWNRALSIACALPVLRNGGASSVAEAPSADNDNGCCRSARRNWINEQVSGGQRRCS